MGVRYGDPALTTQSRSSHTKDLLITFSLSLSDSHVHSGINEETRGCGTELLALFINLSYSSTQNTEENNETLTTDSLAVCDVNITVKKI